MSTGVPVRLSGRWAPTGGMGVSAALIPPYLELRRVVVLASHGKQIDVVFLERCGACFVSTFLGIEGSVRSPIPPLFVRRGVVRKGSVKGRVVPLRR